MLVADVSMKPSRGILATLLQNPVSSQIRDLRIRRDPYTRVIELNEYILDVA